MRRLPSFLPRCSPAFPSALAGLVVLAVVLVGCGGSSVDSVSIDGSSTVFPLTEAVAEEFMEDSQGARVNVGVSGTGGGFSKFLRGETAINDASRPIAPNEIEKAEANGIEFIEIPVAYDGLAVVVHPENDWASCLTAGELREIWKPDSSIDRWGQIRNSYPDRPIKLYGPGTASGTYDYFTEAIVGEAEASRSDFTASEDDNVLVQGITGTETALGYFGLAYYENNADKLKALSIDPDERDGGAPCVTPGAETVKNGRYRPLSRPLFIYVNPAKITPTVEKFVTFYLQNADELASDVGYVAMPDDAYELALQRFQDRTSGTVFGAEGVDATGTQVEEMLREAAEGTAPSDTVAAE
ncbi:PstS family phosphate ABC transporter substrate-binding protein [Salinibacter ruber]|uniref:PstS family phosphate ABC transporter substrate-binding protein n=1 Tax=Salinibacter ruber TaxID=146919 RepID=UPI002167F584|nr:PstS family phosphate ABC transporter substrate-binding protein [Salinibacter ruber]MCS3697703.1 phosphate transport system substrate-binding protein [Salinibacter ruber]